MADIRDLFTGNVARDTFFTSIIVGFGGVAGVLLGIPLVGYILTPLVKKVVLEPSWINVGAVDSFLPGHTREVQYTIKPSAKYPLTQYAGSTATQGAWMWRHGTDSSTSGFTCFSIYCTHLGCPIHWLQGDSAGQGLFLCPCHGSAFYQSGEVAAGPAQRPLNQIELKVEAGSVWIKPSHVPVE